VLIFDIFKLALCTLTLSEMVFLPIIKNQRQKKPIL
jgi:hypothetical protein